MPLIKALLTGDNVDTLLDLPTTPSLILIGTTDADIPIKKLNVTINGNPAQNVAGQTLLQAMSKFALGGLLGVDVKVSQVIKVASGKIEKPCTITLTNSGAFTPNVYGYSEAANGRAIVSGTQKILADGNLAFSGFTGLFFDSANLDRADVTFADGHVEPMTAVELQSMFAQSATTDADGELAGITVIDNRGGNIASVNVFATGGDMTVAFLNL